MAHIIAYGLKKNNLIDLNSDLWKKHYNKQYSLAQFRVTNLQYEYENICKVLEDAEIDYIPLKGAVIRPLYPEAWMRVSSDIDILVHRDIVTEAESVLTNVLGYIVEDETEEYGYHYHIKTPSGFVMELHHALSKRNVKVAKQLDEVWNHVELLIGTNHRYMMDEDIFYLFHIFHASKHFKDGGCGIKTILDTWFINHKLGYSNQVAVKKRSYTNKKNSDGELSIDDGVVKIKLTSDEFLSGLKKGEKLMPIITAVVYIGDKPWDGPRTLQDMLDIKNEALKKFIPNYWINLISPADMDEDEFKKFHTELSYAMRLIKHQKYDADKIIAEEGHKMISAETAHFLKSAINSIWNLKKRTEVSICAKHWKEDINLKKYLQ